jgi:hypothetical protein
LSKSEFSELENYQNSDGFRERLGRNTCPAYYDANISKIALFALYSYPQKCGWIRGLIALENGEFF